MNPEEIAAAIQLNVRWQQLAPFRDEEIDSTIQKISDSIKNKFHNAELAMKDGTSKPVPGSIVEQAIKPKLIMALNPEKDLNREFVKLFYSVILSLDTYHSDSLEKRLQFRDISVLLDLMQYNNELRITGVEPAATIDGLKYFWDVFQEEADNPNEAARKFCIFVGEIAYNSKRLGASSSGYLETLNVLSVRHRNNKNGFRNLMAEEMISEVSW